MSTQQTTTGPRRSNNFESGGWQDQLPPAHDQAELDELLASPRWRDLKPNTPSEEDLLPVDLSASQLEALAGTMQSVDGADPASHKSSLEVSGVGRLDKIGGGEAKTCYRLTTENGKKLAVLICGYDKSLGVQIPDDAHLSTVYDGPTRRLSEYSDLRTYLQIPISDNRGIKLQEFGGQESSSGAGPLPGGLWLARRRAARNIARIPDQTPEGLQGALKELAHARHYLKKSGRSLPQVIDIPVVQRVS